MEVRSSLLQSPTYEYIKFYHINDSYSSISVVILLDSGWEMR